MSEIISSEGVSESSDPPAPKPKPQPFSRDIPQPRQAGESPRTSAIFDESEPVVREEKPAAQPPKVTGNAPERRAAENPFPTERPQPKPTPDIAPVASEDPPSSALRAAEQLRAAAGEKARQLRESADSQAQAAAQRAQAQARARAEAEAHAEADARAAAEAAQVSAIPETFTEPAAQPVSQAAAPAPSEAPALSPSAQQKVDEWKAVAEATWADASVVLKDIRREGERYIRANPTRAAATALGIGFVLGVLLRR